MENTEELFSVILEVGIFKDTINDELFASFLFKSAHIGFSVGSNDFDLLFGKVFTFPYYTIIN